MKGKRNILVEELKTKGIKDENVLKAIAKTPRHFFVLSGLELSAYEDRPLSIDNNQTISQPYTVAFQTELLHVKKNNKILEIGTGSGYQAAILHEIGASVFSVERILNLHKKTKKLFQKLNYKINTFHKDGYQGLPEHAPFDGIIITAAIPEIPEQLLNQIKIGGKIIAPIGKHNNPQKMSRITRISETKYEQQFFGNFIFVPMLTGKI